MSDLWQAQATIAKELFELPGGPLQAAVGRCIVEESIDAPSANPSGRGDQYDRYYSVNSVGTQGSRNVKSGSSKSTRRSSTCSSSTSRAATTITRPVRARSRRRSARSSLRSQRSRIRGTWSKGFRIPSFNEVVRLADDGLHHRTVNCGTYRRVLRRARRQRATRRGSTPLRPDPDRQPERSIRRNRPRSPPASSSSRCATSASRSISGTSRSRT